MIRTLGILNKESLQDITASWLDRLITPTLETEFEIAAAIDELYINTELPPPKEHFFFDNPLEGVMASYLIQNEEYIPYDFVEVVKKAVAEYTRAMVSPATLLKQLDLATDANHDALALYEFLYREFNVPLERKFDGMLNLTGISMFFPFENAVIIVKAPDQYRIKRNGNVLANFKGGFRLSKPTIIDRLRKLIFGK
jgi:hypothetical protein